MTDPWFAIEYGLSIQDLRGLNWFRSRGDAIKLLAENQSGRLADGDHAFAVRLAYAKHLYQTGRISEGALS